MLEEARQPDAVVGQMRLFANDYHVVLSPLDVELHELLDEGDAHHAESDYDYSFPLGVPGYLVPLLHLLDLFREHVGFGIVPLAVAHLGWYMREEPHKRRKGGSQPGGSGGKVGLRGRRVDRR